MNNHNTVVLLLEYIKRSLKIDLHVVLFNSSFAIIEHLVLLDHFLRYCPSRCLVVHNARFWTSWQSMPIPNVSVAIIRCNIPSTTVKVFKTFPFCLIFALGKHINQHKLSKLVIALCFCNQMSHHFLYEVVYSSTNFIGPVDFSFRK